MNRTNENIVSSFFYYMWNRWSKAECETVFGGMAGHFWAKWCGLSSTTLSGAAERFYAELGNNARDKIVERACELYDGQKFVSEKEKDESQIDVCECCGGRNITPEPYDDGWNTRTWGQTAKRSITAPTSKNTRRQSTHGGIHSTTIRRAVCPMEPRTARYGGSHSLSTGSVNSTRESFGMKR